MPFRADRPLYCWESLDFTFLMSTVSSSSSVGCGPEQPEAETEAENLECGLV